MKPLHNNPYSAHQDISLLLPWYVNKTLHGAEMTLVENHLKVCLTCRRELATLHKLAAAVQHEGSLDSAAQVSFSQLKKRIHSTDETRRGKAPEAVSLPGRRKRYGRGWFLTGSGFAVAAALLFSLLTPRFIDTGMSQMNGYRTLSDTEVPVAGRNTIRLIFSSDAKQSEINGIIASVPGRVVDGPTAQGVYTVAVDSALASEIVLDRVASLRKNAHVIFAEPAYALLSSIHADQGAK